MNSKPLINQNFIFNAKEEGQISSSSPNENSYNDDQENNANSKQKSSKKLYIKFDNRDINEIINQNIFHPWINKNNPSYTHSGLIKLHFEIIDFYNFIKLNNYEKKLRQKTYEAIKEIIESNFEKKYSLCIFGSYRTELSLPDSDLNLLIVPKDSNNFKEINKKEQNTLFKNIQQLFLDSKQFSYSELIKKTKTPIIKCTFKETDINVEINSFTLTKYNAIDYIEKILNLFPCMKYLIMVIKYALKQRKLNEIYNGGMSSFLLFHFVFYFIEHIRKLKNNNIYNNLGELLKEFFNFYGFEFNYKELGISVRYGGYLYKRNDGGKNKLSVENFEDVSQDIGKTCFKFQNVMEFFKFARDSLYFPVESPIQSYLAGFILPDDLLNSRNY